MQATRTVHKRLGIIFDFDDTLAPDSFRSLLQRYGIDKERFDAEQVAPLVDAGWDTILARMYCLTRLSEQHPDDPITRELLLDIGRDVQFFAGVPEMFDRVRACATTIVPEIEVCFYLLSSGFLDIVRGTPTRTGRCRRRSCTSRLAKSSTWATARATCRSSVCSTAAAGSPSPSTRATRRLTGAASSP